MMILQTSHRESNSRRVGVAERARETRALRQQHIQRGREDLRHEHRAPATVFSVFAFSQVQLRADCLPQEHLASAAQTQASPERPQQVLGTVMVIWEGLVVEALLDCWCMVV